jgi:autotransporter-associated beta strand protein
LSDGGLGGSLLTGGSGQTLSATNTFIGPITVLSGSLTISGAGLLGGGNFPAILSPQTGSTFIWASSAAQTLSGAFEGGGSVQLTGSGQLTSTATNALTGGFSISSNSTFTVGGAGVMAGAGGGGAYGGAIANSGTFNYNSSAASTLSGTITGTGGKINVNGTGQVTLTSTASTYSNTVSTVTAGVLAYSNDGLTNGASGPPGVVPSTITTNIILNGGDLMGTATFTLNSNRFIGVGPKTGNVGTNALIDSSGGTFTIAGSIISAGNTGSNGLIINSETNGGGTVILTASNNITGPITIDAGVLSIAAPGVLDNGLYAGNITNSGTFDYSGSQPQTLSGVISDGLAGSGTLSLGANGTNLVTLTLTGANTFSGSITIPTGDVLNINGGGLLGAVTGTTGSYAGGVSVSGVINFNSSGSQTVTAGISGPGALSHNGTGKLTLAGSMDYLGPTTNDNGTLALVGDGFSTGFLLETSNITVNAPGIIDPTGLTSDGSLHVGDPNVSQNQQTLSGNGTILSNVIVGTSGTLIPGPAGGFGTLTIGNSLTLNGGGSAVIIGVDHPITGVINDSVTAKSIAVSAGSTLTVSQGANDLQTGDTFHLFNITGNSGISSLHNFALTLPATGPVSGVTYVWNTNNLATTGTLILTTGAAAVPPVSVVPTNLVFALSSGSLQISWPSDHTGWTLQSNSINLAVPADWFNVAGSTTTNKVSIPLGTNGNVFYRLHLNY